MQIVKKYAKLLFEEASCTKMLDRVSEELTALSEAIFAKSEIAKIMTLPSSRKQIEDLISKVMIKYKISGLTSNFIRIIIRLKRLKNLPDMVSEYKKLICGVSGGKTIDVVSARETDKKDRAAINKMLASKFGDGNFINYGVDPTIIGGIVAYCDSRVLDASIKGALKRVTV